MMGGFASRRRAEEFDALLSGRAGVRQDTPAELVELLDVVSTLRSVPPVEARPEYVADLRERLMAAAATELAPVERPRRPVDAETAALLTPRQRRGGRERRLATVIGGFAVVAASGSMAMASEGALPGDALYPMKRAIEDVQTNLQSDDAERAAVLLGHAETRLAEVEALTVHDHASADEIAATLQAFTDHTNQATELLLDDYAARGDVRAITALREFTVRSMSLLAAIGDDLPAEARPALITAAQTVRQVDTAAFQVCPTCGDAPITELPDFTARSLEALITPSLGTAVVTVPDLLPEQEGRTRARTEEEQPQRTDEQPPADVEAPAAPTAEEPLPENPFEPSPSPSEEPNVVDEVTKGLKDTGDKDNDGDGDKDVGIVTDGVVDGVSGLVDGLLGTEQ